MLLNRSSGIHHNSIQRNTIEQRLRTIQANSLAGQGKELYPNRRTRNFWKLNIGSMYHMTHPANPLAGLISDEVYALLNEHNLLSEKAIRDYQIRQQFRKMRRQDIPAYEAIEQLREQYAYLQFDTIRKIVYGLGKR